MAAGEDKGVMQMQATSTRLLQTTPGLAEKLASTAKSGGSRANFAAASAAGGRQDDRDAVIGDLQRQLDTEKEKNRTLEDSYKFRVMSFVQRETQTKNKIDALERRLNDGPEADDHNTRMEVIEDMHKTVVAGLDCIQNNTAKILQDQEKDLMRAFRAKLQEVSDFHEAQKSKKGGESTELQAKHRQVVQDLHEAQELAHFYNQKFKEEEEKNQKLSEKLRTREDDSKAVVKELVLAKKELARMKAQSKESAGVPTDGDRGLQEESTPITRRKEFSQRQIEQAQLQQTRNKQYEREVSYRDAITKLKRMVEAERKTIRGLRQQMAEVLQQRSELEVLMRQCLDDVKGEIVRNRPPGSGSGRASPDGGLPGSSTQDVSKMSVHELSAQDRERVLELLLSQQRVVQLLYSKTFSHNNPPSPLTREDGTAGSAPSGARPNSGLRDPDEFAWLGDILPAEPSS